MMVKVFTKNENGKIEFTEEELKKLLNEVFYEGYNSNNHSYIWSSPYTGKDWWSNPSITWTSDSSGNVLTYSSSDINASNNINKDIKAVTTNFTITEEK